MILYPAGKFHARLLCQVRGSVFPFAALAALPVAVLSVVLQVMSSRGELEDSLQVLGVSDRDTVAGQVWTGVTSLLGFVIVFRTSQAYSRFWEGTSSIYQMMGEWFDATSSLVAFCKCSSANMLDVAVFQHTLVRLVSMLSAVVLMDLSSAPQTGASETSEAMARAFELELIDAEGIDRESLVSINETEHKVELIFHWINQLIVENNSRGMFSVAPPILSRAFQELANGMIKYHDGMKIAQIPLPFPYIQTLEVLLALHWAATPFLTSMWVKSALWAGVGTFVQVFVLWALNAIAAELENPFGEDVNDLPAQLMQQEMNKRLLLLIRPTTQRTARLSDKAVLEESLTEDGQSGSLPTKMGFGKAGVSGVLKTESRLSSRRISLGQLQAAIADQALVALNVEEVDAVEDAEAEALERWTTGTDQSLAPPMPRKPTRKITIRDVSACQPDPGGFKRCASPSSNASATALATPEGSAGLPRSLSAMSAEYRFMQLQEGVARDVAELVSICNEMRSSSRRFGQSPCIRNSVGEHREPRALPQPLGSPSPPSAPAVPPDPADPGRMTFKSVGSRG